MNFFEAMAFDMGVALDKATREANFLDNGVAFDAMVFDNGVALDANFFDNGVALDAMTRDRATLAGLFVIWMLAVTLGASGAVLWELRLPINDFFWIAMGVFSSISFCLLPGSLQYACALTYCDSMAKLAASQKSHKLGKIGAAPGLLTGIGSKSHLRG
jgi:hypothetical protein